MAAGDVVVVAETRRLILRRFRAADLDALIELNGDPEVMRYITGRPTPVEEVRDRLLPDYLAPDARGGGLGGGLGHWAADERASGSFIGWFSLRPVDGQSATLELGYRLQRAAWGRGFATEGARTVLRLAFSVFGAHRVTAQTMTINTRSRRVMERIGLRFVRTFHGEWPDPIEGANLGDVEYALDLDQWLGAGRGQAAAD